MEYQTTLIVLALVFGFYMAWNIGANDVANAMGTSVGSGALTFKRAVILAAILEFAGAFFVGSHVSDTVRKGIVDPALFAGDPQSFVLGMLSALLAAGLWLQFASRFGWPVSTTHSIIGAIIGFGIVYGGMSAVHWDKVSTIAASWVISPLMSGTISFIVFQIVLHRVFYRADPVEAVRKFTPYMVFIVLMIMTLVMVFKGLKNLHLDLSFSLALLVSSGVGLLGALLSYVLLRNYKSDDKEEEQQQARELYVARALQRSTKHLLRAQRAADSDTRDTIDSILELTQATTDTSSKRANLGSSRPEFRRTERIFIYLQILTACFIAFAHGANDVANAIGPLSAAVQTAQDGLVAAKATVPLWALLLGGTGNGNRWKENYCAYSISRFLCPVWGSNNYCDCIEVGTTYFHHTHPRWRSAWRRACKGHWCNQPYHCSGYRSQLGDYNSSRCAACNRHLHDLGSVLLS